MKNENDLRADSRVERLLRNRNWQYAAEAAIDYLFRGIPCQNASWRKSSTWAQVQMVYDELPGGGTARHPQPPQKAVDSHLEIRGHAGQQIRSFADWEKHALPPYRKEQHWKEGRSAFELGWSWTSNGEPAGPAELVQLLESQEGTRRTVIKSGITEHETALPFSSRGARCHDLSLQAERDGCVVTICIEAKADEPFGGTVAEELRKARQRSSETRFPERLDWLTRSLLGVPAFKDDERLLVSDVVSGLPYQLFSAIAGTLLEAQLQGATTAVFVVHEFRTNLTEDAKLAANAGALNSFLHFFCSVNGGPDEDLHLRPGEIIGPISITERPLAGVAVMPFQIPLFIGKVRTDRLI